MQLLPVGTFAGRDGRGPYHLADARAVIAATLSRLAGVDMPIDYDHQLVRTPMNGAGAVAAGWSKELEARDDGIWGRVGWTERARAHLAAHEYRYISPVFAHDQAGQVLWIESAGLVNNLNLELVALASRRHNRRTQ